MKRKRDDGIDNLMIIIVKGRKRTNIAIGIEAI